MSTIPLPKTRLTRFLTALPFYDILIAIFTLAGGTFAGVLLLQGPEHIKKVGGVVSIVASVAIAGFNIVKAGLQWKSKDTKDSPHELEGCLSTLYAILITEGQADPGLRITVHVPREDGQNLVQALGYVGSQRKPKTAGRVTPVSCGITGRAYRMKKPVLLKRGNNDINAYIQELMETQGFTQEQAGSVDHSTMSGYAFPLTDPNGTVEGIVYADAVDPDFFTDARIITINLACSGIARFVQRKYAV